MNDTNDPRGLQELKHDAVPGYRPAFFVAVTVGLAYLGILLACTL